MGIEVTAFIGMGANLGTDDEIRARFRRALELLAQSPAVRVAAVSGIYETEPWGDADQPRFLNAAARLRTTLSPPSLLDALKAVESRLGRTASRRWGPREIDLDILLYGDREVAAEGLQIPHPRLLERAFAVIPVLELDPEAALPDATTLRYAARAVLNDPGVRKRDVP
jgi:2-amino-4-hydroxy-6-hydroxymethyldihydropteridine diphosphokinase